MYDAERDRALLRAQIRPYSRDPRYPTGWSTPLTFQEIQESLTPNLNRLMRYYRYTEADIPDMIAHGFMRLWEELSAKPDLMTHWNHGDALAWTMYRSGIGHYRKFFRREMYLEELATRSGEPDAFIIDGFDRGHRRTHASWAERVDHRYDIERAMHFMAEKYHHSHKHLIALYYITTSVSPDDAAELAGCGGTKKSWWLTSVVKPMREELSELLGLSRPGKMTWQEKLQAGQQEPLSRLLDDYRAKGNDRMTATLENLVQRGSTKALMQQLDIPKTHANYLRLTAHRELNKAYGCRV